MKDHEKDMRLNLIKIMIKSGADVHAPNPDFSKMPHLNDFIDSLKKKKKKN